MARRRTEAPPPPIPATHPPSAFHAFVEFPLPKLPARARREAALIGLATGTLLYLSALVALSWPDEGGLLSAGIRGVVIPMIGYAGAWALLVPLTFGLVALLRERPGGLEPLRSGLWGASAYSTLLLVAAITWGGIILRGSQFFLRTEDQYQVGWIGMTLSGMLIALANPVGAKVMLIGVVALALPLLTGLSWPALFRAIALRFQAWRESLAVEYEEVEETEEEDEGDLLAELAHDNGYAVAVSSVDVEPVMPKRKRNKKVPLEDADELIDEADEEAGVIIERMVEAGPARREVAVINTNFTIDEEGHDADRLELLMQGTQAELGFKPSFQEIPYEFPSLKLMADPPIRTAATENVDGVPEMVEKALAEYGITAYVERIIVGPSITRVECIPSDGTRMSKIANMEGDLAFHLAAKSVRVEAPIPGRKAVGIEFPNKVKDLVTLKEILASEEYQSSKSLLTVGLGKDLAGKPIVADLSKMPHLLIAGQTGAGKSVCLNTIIMSLLLRAHPSLVKMILVDPKRVELTVYDGLPHLLVPVVQDVKKALNALNWAIVEMDDRYKVLQKARARNISEYNARHRTNPMPYIVIIIDELADLMDVGASDIERLINRLARLARAVGIHLILATQRPDVKVITGQIKANIPTRIAFKVASIVDSKTILDYSGADKLLGFGDMLFKAIGESKPIRAQGCYVDEAEIGGVVQFITNQIEPEYNEEILVDREEDLAKGAESGDEDLDGGNGDDGEYWDEALQITLQEGKISASMLQRKLRIGYNRASRLVDIMEAKGIISGPNGARPRDVIRADLYQSVEDL